MAALLAGPAMAADMAVKARPQPVPAPVAVYNWTGCYIGGNVGGADARIRERSTSVAGVALDSDFGRSSDTGLIGGGQIGCDYQFANSFVVGVQGMFDFTDLNSHQTLPAFPTFFSETRTRDVFTVTGRVGYLFTPAVLAYVKGGGAWARIDTTHFGTVPAPTFVSETALRQDRQGWTIGGGLEWMVAGGWSVFGEYNFMDFGTETVNFINGPGTVGAPSVVRTRYEIQQALFGVNYKFNLGGGPVAARY